MQHPSTYSGPRSSTKRGTRAISPINAAQRAGYMLDAAPATPSAQPAAKTAATQGQASTAAKPH